MEVGIVAEAQSTHSPKHEASRAHASTMSALPRERRPIDHRAAERPGRPMRVPAVAIDAARSLAAGRPRDAAAAAVVG
jgi:hypothetical protein